MNEGNRFEPEPNVEAGGTVLFGAEGQVGIYSAAGRLQVVYQLHPDGVLRPVPTKAIFEEEA